MEEDVLEIEAIKKLSNFYSHEDRHLAASHCKAKAPTMEKV
ncbi:hypothetical protein Q9292_14090 [Methylophilus sp. VKM B-3414]|nr:hypothetical protein [Methylophilus sp. VKM B-3414]